MREALALSPGCDMCFFLPCDIWWLNVGSCSGCEQQRDCLVGSGMVPSRFGDESNLAGGNCHSSTCGSVAQWPECSHGMREVLGSSPGRAICFFLPRDIWWLNVGPCSGKTVTDFLVFVSVNLEEMCGQHLNLKWKGIHTAEIRLNSAVESRVISTSENETRGANDESVSPTPSYTVISGIFFCTLIIESWDFQDRMMFYFKGIQAEPKCTHARLEVLDGPTHTSPPVPGNSKLLCDWKFKQKINLYASLVENEPEHNKTYKKTWA